MLDRAGQVRRAAAWSLARIGLPDAEAAKAKLMEELPDTDERDRAQVVWTLAVLREAASADALLDAFSKGQLSHLDGFSPKVVAEVLDLIGDLALLGRPLIGRVIAERAGHAMHAAVVERIMQDPSCYELVTSEEVTPRETAVSAGPQPVGQQEPATARRRPLAIATPFQV
jgi:hypothetical protein